jgi:hypothetical protein
MTNSPSGLFTSLAILANVALDIAGHLGGGALGRHLRGNVEIGLVQRHAFHQGRVAAEDGVNLPRNRSVLREVRGDEHRFRAQALGAGAWQRRADAVFAGLVAGSHDDAAAGRRPSHDDRKAQQLRPVPNLHGGVERVHVDVENAAHRRGLFGSSPAGGR